jgi:hypothetical protein
MGKCESNVVYSNELPKGVMIEVKGIVYVGVKER